MTDPYQPPSTPQPPPYGTAPMLPHVASHLVWGILTLICCCPPFGIVSIVFATQVNVKLRAGDVAGAQAASRKAGTWAIVAALSGVVLWVLTFLALGGLAWLGYSESQNYYGY